MSRYEDHGTGWCQTEALVDVLQALDVYDPRDDAAEGDPDFGGPDYADVRERLAGEDFDIATLRTFGVALNELNNLVHEVLADKISSTFASEVRSELGRTR